MSEAAEKIETAEEPRAAEKPASAPDVIVAKALRKAYGDFVAVDSVDFAIRQGECFGFLGPNGAGKTTTMQTIIGLARRTGGELSVFGFDPAVDSREVRQRVGVVPQEDNLDPDLSVRDNLIVYARYFGIATAAARKKADELIAFVQLEAKSDVRITKLSGGMKRRLVLARALIQDPEAIMLDEPTTGLDPQARHLMWQKLRQLKAQAVTQVLTTHYMEEAAQLCDRLAIMDHGQILDLDTPRALIARHVGEQVVEVRQPQNLPAAVLRDLAEGPWKRETAGDTWLFFVADAEPILNLLRSARDAVYQHRPAGLEDVFLKLTGRDLRE